MSFYELLLLLHVAAAIVWLGAGFLFAVLVLGAERAGDREKSVSYQRDVDWLAPRLFVPASLAVFVLGVLMVIDGAWSFGELWIVIAMAGWAASFALGFFYFKPEEERILALVDERGPRDPEVGERSHRLAAIDRVQLTILFVIVADMVVKPTGADGAELVIGCLIVAAAIAFAALSLRRGPEPAARLAGGD